MLVRIEKPNFLTALPKAIGKTAGEWHWHSILPVWGLICATIGAGVAYNMPLDFWSKDRQGVAALIYIAIFLLDGFLVSLCWSTFTKMYEAMSAPGFFSYLVDEELMPGYIVYIQMVHSIQLFSIFTSSVGIVILLLVPPNVIYDQIALAIMVMSTAYGLKTVSHLTHVMQDVLWQKAIVDDFPGKQRSGQVIPLERMTEQKVTV